MEAAHVLSQVNSQTTRLTVNCVSVVTFQNDSNLTCNSVFTYQGNYLWVTITNSTSTQQTLSADSSAGPVTLHAGAVVNEQILGNVIVVRFTGEITDAGSKARFNNTPIGSFIQAPPPSA
jgi:hypothetical protein